MAGTATASPTRAYFDDYVRHGFPMGRLGTAEEVADVIVFIASPRAYWINGRNIPVDGLEQPHAPLDRRAYYCSDAIN
jgi:NAD(P)-dependent dehydrogenase (short-subunit alcohol dehydrogenase family)